MTAERPFFATLVDHASALFRPSGAFAYHYTRGKLGMDPIFHALLAQGLLSGRERILDLGCGQGSLFACLLAARVQADQGRWPAHWPPAPQARQLRGVELMPKDVARAAQAFAAHRNTVNIEQGDMCTTDFGEVDAVTILDALHYFDHQGQRAVLARIHAALAPGGVFITRIGNAAAGWPFRLSQGVDHVVTFLRGHRLPRLYCRPLAEWVQLLEQTGFQVEVQSMSGRTPFANVMLIGRR